MRNAATMKRPKMISTITVTVAAACSVACGPTAASKASGVPGSMSMMAVATVAACGFPHPSLGVLRLGRQRSTYSVQVPRAGGPSRLGGTLLGQGISE